MTKPITQFDIEVTFDHSQYFQGAGIAFTDWEDRAVGFGTTTAEALDDALDLLASDGWDSNDIDTKLPEHGMECECKDGDECEHGWYVTVYVR